MTIGLKLGSITDEIGGQDFFHAFFSTVSYRLENDVWGERFPCLLIKLYQGELDQDYANQALDELNTIKSELYELTPDKVVWDIENLSLLPPWGDAISSDIKNLSHYFITSSGRDLIDVLKENLEELRDRGGKIKVVSI